MKRDGRKLDQRWPGEFGQDVKWTASLKAAIVPQIRRRNDETNTQSRSRLQGLGSVGRAVG